MTCNRSDYPPAIGTIESVVTTSNGDSLQEIPIIETFDIRGETFALVLDIDWFGVDGLDEDDAPGDVMAYHVGTGIRSVRNGEWGAPGWVKCRTESLWHDSGWKDLYATAEAIGCPKVRGTIIPLPKTGEEGGA